MIFGVAIIILFIIVSVLTIIKLANEKQAIALKVLIFGFIFVLVTGGYVYIKYDVDISNFSDIISATKIYFAWLGTLWDNSVNTVGYVINQDWSPPNVTNSTR